MKGAMSSPEERPDDELRGIVARLAVRDELAWMEFVDRFAPLMYAYFRREFDCGHASGEDFTAESLWRILQSIARFDYRTPNQFKAWVFAIARNVGIDHVRRTFPECPLPDYLQEIPSSPLEPQCAADLVIAVREALDRLPQTGRRVLQLHYFQGLSPRDVALQLGISYGTVRVRLHRALRELELILCADDRILSRLRKQ